MGWLLSGLRFILKNEPFKKKKTTTKNLTLSSVTYFKTPKPAVLTAERNQKQPSILQYMFSSVVGQSTAMNLLMMIFLFLCSEKRELET